MKEDFNLERKYQFYLKTVGMNELNMSAIQKQEMRRCFFGACGIMLTVITDLIELEDNNIAYEEYASMVNQVQNFFLQDMGRQN